MEDALREIDEETRKLMLVQDIGTDPSFKRKYVWQNVLVSIVLHAGAGYGLFLSFSGQAYISTNVWMVLLGWTSGLAITVGAHRLYSHKAFKTVFAVRLVLILLQTLAGQNCLYIWVRDHRLHHKYSDTDADPHNSNRGFFFSHMGWLMSRKHPLVKSKGREIVMKDLEDDPLVMFQKKYYITLYLIFALLIPVATPVYLWNETLLNSFFLCYFFRYVVVLHFTWVINSFTHLYGMKPYDQTIKPVENAFVAFLSQGEGWHNYHHSFPSDYTAAEYNLRYSATTLVIDILAYLGLAYDLKVTNPELVRNRVQKKGDGSHPVYLTKAQRQHRNEE